MSLTTADLKYLIKLSETKDALQAELDSVNAKINSALIGKPGASPKVKSKTRKIGRSNLKGAITGLLKSAEGATITVKDLASKLGIKNQSIHVWFNTTGKKIEEIKKVGAGAYAWATAPLTSQVSKKSRKPKNAPAKKAKVAAKVKKSPKAKTAKPANAAPKKDESSK